VALPLIYSPDWETKNEKQFPTYIDFNVIQNSELHTHIGPTWGWGVYGKKLDFSSNTEHIYNEEFAVDNHTSISEGSPIFTAGFGGDPNVWHINDRNWIHNFLGKVPGDWDAHYGLMNFEEDHTFFKRHLSDDILEAYYHGCIEDSKAIIIDTTKNNTTFTSEHAREMPGRHHTYNYTYGMGKTPIIHYGELKSITISSQDVSGSNANPHRQMVTGTLDNTAYFAHKPNNIHPINDDDQKPIVFRSVSIINPVAHGTRRQINDVAYNTLVLVPQPLNRRGWNTIMYKVYGGTPAPDFSVGPQSDPTASQENPTLGYVDGYGSWKMKRTTSPYAWEIDKDLENSEDYQLGNGTVETNYGVKEKIKFEYDYNPNETYKGLPLRGRYVFNDFTYENSSGKLSIGTSSEGDVGDHVPYSFKDVPRRIVKIPKLNVAWKNITITSKYEDKLMPLLEFGSGIVGIRSINPVSEESIASRFYTISDEDLMFVKSNKNIRWNTLISFSNA